jgi:hypothetical protein
VTSWGCSSITCPVCGGDGGDCARCDGEGWVPYNPDDYAEGWDDDEHDRA